ncbi:hypothetical protein GCWU000324_00501 [Kingella oralis ATCC 51147]|uniref:Uncharacterized protein n=1 Tax=Kingella oralis ATCC 51147 TaxID=629741 RepID=C4GI10_9NEIS|nr:hypothetical protein GCWU000324_00501 [Kingella oralis ATCC 51147]
MRCAWLSRKNLYSRQRQPEKRNWAFQAALLFTQWAAKPFTKIPQNNYPVHPP